MFPSGVKTVFELRLASGRSVKASGNHPFLALEGWFPLDKLDVGDRIAVPRGGPWGPTVGTDPDGGHDTVPRELWSYLRKALPNRGLTLHSDVGAAQYRERYFGDDAARMRGHEFYRVAWAEVAPMSPVRASSPNPQRVHSS